MKKTETIETQNFIMNISMPKEPKEARVGLMFHGWTGDETSMWVFANQLLDDWLLIAPRAPYPTQGSDFGGYSWINQRIDHWPQYQDFLPGLNMLDLDLDELKNTISEINLNQISVIGFSQGGAAAFVYSMVNFRRVSKLAMLSSFCPDSSEGFIPKERSAIFDVFIGHGTKDEIVQ